MSVGLCEEFSALRQKLEAGHEPDPVVIEDLLARIEKEAPDMPRESVVELCDHVEFLEDLLYVPVGGRDVQLVEDMLQVRSPSVLFHNDFHICLFGYHTIYCKLPFKAMAPDNASIK